MTSSSSGVCCELVPHQIILPNFVVDRACSWHSWRPRIFDILYLLTCALSICSVWRCNFLNSSLKGTAPASGCCVARISLAVLRFAALLLPSFVMLVYCVEWSVALFPVSSFTVVSFKDYHLVEVKRKRGSVFVNVLYIGTDLIYNLFN